MKNIFVNRRTDVELNRYFTRIQATCARKMIITLFDLLYLLALNLPIFVIIAYYKPKDGFIDAFHKLVEKTSAPEAWRMFGFSWWMIFVLYIYFVFIPSKTNYQTFFSSYLGMKAVSIEDSLNWRAKLSQKQLFKANIVPLFLSPFIFSLFFLFCAACGKNSNWHTDLLQKKVFSLQSSESSWGSGVALRGVTVLFLAASAIQIFYLFTVGASKKALNWFTASNGMLYVNVERAMMVMSTEDKPLPNVANTSDVAAPGGREEVVQNDEARQEISSSEEGSNEIDFSANIDVEVESFLESLNKKDKGAEGELESSEGEDEESKKSLKGMDKIKKIFRKRN